MATHASLISFSVLGALPNRLFLFGSAPSTEKDISDAWVAKMQQVYQKAAMSFPNDPVFAQIRNLYEGKMAELKMKID